MMSRFDNELKWLPLPGALATFLFAMSATAGIHTWDVVEVFSNHDGTIQYVELFDFGAGGTETGVGNGSITSTAQSHNWANGPVTGPTNGKSYLIATAGFAALPGAPVPDVIISAGSVPFFSIAGDTVTFQNGDALTFGAVPINGTDSFNETGGAAPNSPKNYAGTQGSVNAGGPPAVPSVSTPMFLILGMLLLTFGWRRLGRPLIST